MLLYSKTLYAIYINSANFGTAFLVILAFFSILNFKYFRDTYFYLFLTFVLYAIIEGISTYLPKTSQNSQWINYVYAILAATLPSVFYLKSIKNNLLNKITIPFILVFVIFSIFQFSHEVFNKKPFEQVFLFPLKNVIAFFLALVLHTKLSQSTKLKSFKNELSKAKQPDFGKLIPIIARRTFQARLDGRNTKHEYGECSTGQHP